jgi:hypothetical protein
MRLRLVQNLMEKDGCENEVVCTWGKKINKKRLTKGMNGRGPCNDAAVSYRRRPSGKTKQIMSINFALVVVMLTFNVAMAVSFQTKPGVGKGAAIEEVGVKKSEHLKDLKDGHQKVRGRGLEVEQNKRKRHAIVNGWTVNDLEKERFQFAASIKYGSSFLCAGSLVAPDLILSAAHCFYEKDTIGTGDGDSDGYVSREVDFLRVTVGDVSKAPSRYYPASTVGSLHSKSLVFSY